MDYLAQSRHTSDFFFKPVFFNSPNTISHAKNLRLRGEIIHSTSICQSVLEQEFELKLALLQNLCYFHFLLQYLRNIYKSEKYNWHLLNVPGTSLILLNTHNHSTRNLVLIELMR